MSLLRRQFLSLIASSSTLAMSNANAESAPSDMPHVPWSRQAAIYEINVRQFTAEGTLKAATADLPRLKRMGGDILWLMPIQPIGKLNRKGTLGSDYSIRDYTAVNPEFGTLSDARAFVQAAHAQGMKVILDSGAPELRDWAAKEPHGFPPSAYRMRFTTNHDFNSWNGTDAELYGDNYPPLAVLTFTLPGMPLIYGGRESRLTKRLEFFEKEPIAWKTRELQPFYTRLLALKHAHPALANGQYGGALTLLDVGNERLFAFKRALGADSVTVVINVTASEQKLRLGGSARSLPEHGWLIEST